MISKIIRIAIWSLIAAVCLCVLVVAITSRGVVRTDDIFDFFNIDTDWEDYEVSESAQSVYTADPVESIRIEALEYSVELVREARDDVRIALFRDGRPYEDDAYFAKGGGEITLRIPNRFFNFFGIGRAFHSYRMVVSIPENTENVSLVIGTASGEITLERGGTFNRIEFSTASGDIEVDSALEARSVDIGSVSGEILTEEIKCSGEAAFRSTSGSIRVKKVDAEENVKFSSVSGSIRCEELRSGDKAGVSSTSGSVDMGNTVCRSFTSSTVSGRIQVSGLSGQGKLSSTSGELYVNVNDLTGDLSLNTISGSVRCELPVGADVGVSMSSLSGSKYSDFGSSGAHSLNASTTSGSIRIVKK